MRSNGIKANKRYFHSQDILDPKKNNKQMINSLKNFTNQSNQTFSKTNNFFPKYKYNNIFTSYNNINDYLPLRFKSSIINENFICSSDPNSFNFSSESNLNNPFSVLIINSFSFEKTEIELILVFNFVFSSL